MVVQEVLVLGPAGEGRRGAEAQRHSPHRVAELPVPHEDGKLIEQQVDAVLPPHQAAHPLEVLPPELGRAHGGTGQVPPRDEAVRGRERAVASSEAAPQALAGGGAVPPLR